MQNGMGWNGSSQYLYFAELNESSQYFNLAGLKYSTSRVNIYKYLAGLNESSQYLHFAELRHRSQLLLCYRFDKGSWSTCLSSTSTVLGYIRYMNSSDPRYAPISNRAEDRTQLVFDHKGQPMTFPLHSGTIFVTETKIQILIHSCLCA